MNVKKITQKIEKHYACHNVLLKVTKCEIVKAEERLVFTLKIQPGTKENMVFERAKDIQIALQLALFQPFKEGLSIRLAVSERPITENSLSKMLKTPMFIEEEKKMLIALGYDMRGGMHYEDLTKFPHALYAGASNSGKTVGLRSFIVSLIVKHTANEVNLVMIDTGASGLDLFNALPHLSYPIIKDEETVINVILCLIDEMERRIALLESELLQLPIIVCIIDEYISLVSNIEGIEKKKILTTAISSLLRRGRHAKIHLVLATQESAKQDMLINTNNINARMAFRCSDFYNSRSILSEGGAEKLPGNGAMLFKSLEHPKPVYLQGAFISTEEIKKLMTLITSISHDFSNKFVIHEIDPSQNQMWVTESLSSKPSKSDGDKELADIIFWIMGRKNVSVRQIKQNFHIGNRANDMMDELFRMNLVADKFANQPRAVLPTCYEDLSIDIIILLNSHSYTMENIQEILNIKKED